MQYRFSRKSKRELSKVAATKTSAEIGGSPIVDQRKILQTLNNGGRLKVATPTQGFENNTIYKTVNLQENELRAKPPTHLKGAWM